MYIIYRYLYGFGYVYECNNIYISIMLVEICPLLLDGTSFIKCSFNIHVEEYISIFIYEYVRIKTASVYFNFYFCFLGDVLS